MREQPVFDGTMQLEITVKDAVDGHEPERIQIEHASSGATSIRAR